MGRADAVDSADVTAPAEDAGPPRVRVLRIISRMNVGGPALHALLLNDRLDPSRYESRLVAGRVVSGEVDLVAHRFEVGG